MPVIKTPAATSRLALWREFGPIVPSEQSALSLPNIFINQTVFQDYLSVLIPSATYSCQITPPKNLSPNIFSSPVGILGSGFVNIKQVLTPKKMDGVRGWMPGTRPWHPASSL